MLFVHMETDKIKIPNIGTTVLVLGICSIVFSCVFLISIRNNRGCSWEQSQVYIQRVSIQIFTLRRDFKA